MPAISASSFNSTFVYQRDEIKNGFWPAYGYATFFITGDFAMLRNGIGGSMPAKYKTIDSRVISTCSATTASKSTAPSRTRPAAR